MQQRQGLVAPPDEGVASGSGRRFGSLLSLWDGSFFGRAQRQRQHNGTVHTPLPAADLETGLVDEHPATLTPSPVAGTRHGHGFALPFSRLLSMRAGNAAEYTAVTVDDSQEPPQQHPSQQPQQEQQQQQQQVALSDASVQASKGYIRHITSSQADSTAASGLRYHQSMPQHQLQLQGGASSSPHANASSPLGSVHSSTAGSYPEAGVSPGDVEASSLNRTSSRSGAASDAQHSSAAHGANNSDAANCANSSIATSSSGRASVSEPGATSTMPQLRQPGSLVREGSWGTGLNPSMVGALATKASVAAGGPSSAGLARSSSNLMPTCLICLDGLTAADFESGEALSLQCNCKGEVSLRHRSCAIKWSQVKGSTVCDVCKAPIANLPPVAPRPEGFGEEGELGVDGYGGEPPVAADYVFDCIRVTWVCTIVCVLFFELSVARSFFTGAVVGAVYTAFTRALHRHHRRYMQAAQGQQFGGQQGSIDGGLAASAVILV